MKAIISDIDILKNLEPNQVAAYLQQKGWLEKTNVPNKVSIWVRDTFASDRLKIYLPLDLEFDDYSRRMFEVMEILEKVENRSQLEIVSELITNYCNITVQGMVIQIQAPNTDKLNGEIIIYGLVIDKLQKITTQLKDKNYILALKAYQERLPIICVGDLVKEKDIFILINVSQFIVNESH
jgi:cell division FtsZ-interacting protein ZapD